MTENTGKANPYDGWDDDSIIADIRDAVAARDDAQARAENLAITPDSSTEAEVAKAVSMLKAYIATLTAQTKGSAAVPALLRRIDQLETQAQNRHTITTTDTPARHIHPGDQTPYQGAVWTVTDVHDDETASTETTSLTIAYPSSEDTKYAQFHLQPDAAWPVYATHEEENRS